MPQRLDRAQFVAPGEIRATSKSNQFAGISTIASGTLTVTVSTTLVQSDSVIDLAVRAAVPGSRSQVGLDVYVSTISPLNFFTLATADGQNTPVPLNVMWKLWQSTI